MAEILHFPSQPAKPRLVEASPFSIREQIALQAAIHHLVAASQKLMTGALASEVREPSIAASADAAEAALFHLLNAQGCLQCGSAAAPAARRARSRKVETVMPFKRKLPDRATLAAHCEDGMTPAKIAERYDCRLDSVRHQLQTYGLLAVKPKSIPIEMAGKGPAPQDRSKRGIFLHADRVTIMRDTACEFGGLAIRPLSLPRISMHIAQLAKKHPSLMGGQNA